VSERFVLALAEALAPWRLEPSVGQVRILAAHFAAVLDVNRQFNLTRATDPVDAAVTLYADSLAVVAWAERQGVLAGQVLDAGTGAGFPGVPVAVLQPRWQVTAVDATGKKARFVEQTARRLGIDNLRAVHARVEHLHPPPTYDLVLFKAVSQIDRCLKWCQYLVARGGCVVLYKTPGVSSEEETAGRRMADRLAYIEADPFPYTLPRGEDRLDRALRVFVKQ
jgi:16S rRNA (guanine527-N7)-methyltransferase